MDLIDRAYSRHRLIRFSGTLVAVLNSGENLPIMSQVGKAPQLSQDALARILDVTQKLALPYDLMHLLAESLRRVNRC